MRPAGRGRRTLLALLMLACAQPAGSLAASYPPRLHFRSLEAPHVSLIYHQGLEAMAREAVALAEQILSAHEARYGSRVPRVRIVLADVEDDPNGFASPVPYPLVQLRAASPDGTDSFGNFEGWLRLALTHELAHVVHLEPARRIPGFGRLLLGRAPYLFPNALTPQWLIEGLATFEETQGTAFGRGRDPDSRMVLRMSALEEGSLPDDVAATFPDRWPAGHAPYLFGEAFLRDLSEHLGADTLPRLARAHSGRLIPFLDELTAQGVTGSSFHAHWAQWRERQRAAAEAEAARVLARGVTPTRALTATGVRQDGPRASPDGSLVAYTSRSLTGYTSIRLVRAAGGGDRFLAHRNGGETLAWTPDGRAIVFDEPEVHELFSVRSDLRVVEVASGRVRRLTRGLRARDPDVAPDGRSVVFVRREADRSELASLALDGSGLRDLTSSEPGTQWSGPRVSPDGARVVAARWTRGGFLDLVLLDLASGALTPLTHDRAKDVEPDWTPDGSHVVFRSDRDGVSNLYALRLSDGVLLRVTNVLGGAFRPSVTPDGRGVVFALYRARGYDVHAAALDLDALAPAEPFEDRNPAPRPDPPPVGARDRPYRPLGALLPRFWSPYAFSSSGQWRIGAATGGADPLVRHAYGLAADRGTDTERWSGQGFYQYDRFRPTLLLSAEDTSEPEDDGRLSRTQQVRLGAGLPLSRSYRSSQTLGLAWRFERETLSAAPDAATAERRLDLGGLELSWERSSARRFPYSISPVEGWRLRLAAMREDPAFGSDVSLTKASADVRGYVRLLGASDALALRAGGGTTFGRPSFERSFSVGGFGSGELFDVVLTEVGVLRGFPDQVESGRSVAYANLEYRFPLAHPQRGWGSAPLFLRHLHGTLFGDAAHAWSGSFRLDDVKAAAGAALGTDLVLGHGLPTTASLGVAQGFGPGGETRVYFRMRLAF